MDEVHSKERKASTRLELLHPSRYEHAMIEGEDFAGVPHLCQRNPRVYEAMFEYARLAIEELDFDGLRFDFVKGYGAWMIGLLAKYRYQKKDGREFTPFVLGEYWSGPSLFRANQYTPSKVIRYPRMEGNRSAPCVSAGSILAVRTIR
jgi:hypothetical protein